MVINLSCSEFDPVAFVGSHCTPEDMSIDNASNGGRFYEVDDFWLFNKFDLKTKHNHMVIVNIVHFKFFIVLKGS